MGVFGQVGLWVSRSLDREQRDAALAVAAAGAFDAVWLSGGITRGVFDDLRAVLARVPALPVGTAVVNIWTEPAERCAAEFAALEAEWPGRLHLGLGVSHAPAVAAAGLGDYRRPLATMAAYLDAVAAAPVPVPPERMLLGALGPRMVGLAADRTLGAVPYLVTTEYLAGVRSALPAGRVLAPMVPVVLDADLDRARATARGHLATYLGLPNYTRNLECLGFGPPDLAAGGSDALLDAIYALGDAARIRDRLRDTAAAGADHVALTVIPGPSETTADVLKALDPGKRVD